MRVTIFEKIIDLLQGVQKLQSESGIVHVYDYPITEPAGYPYAVVGSVGVEAVELSNQQDKRSYVFSVQLVGEKFGEEAGKTQSQALAVMRVYEDALLDAFSANNDLGLGLQIIVMKPINVDWNFSEDRQHVILTMRLLVERAVDITM